MESIISNERVCYVCGTSENLHRHHIFFGRANRKLSEKYGCWCYLCGKDHNLSDKGVHFNKLLDDRLKRECQARFELNHTREEFMQIFGKNWL